MSSSFEISISNGNKNGKGFDPVVNLQNKFPANTMSDEEKIRLDELTKIMSRSGPTRHRYTDQQVADIFKGIFVEKLSDSEVAKRFGCTAKYSWNIRKGFTRKVFLADLHDQFIQGVFEDGAKSEAALAVSLTDDVAVGEFDNKSQSAPTGTFVVTCTDDDENEIDENETGSN